MPDHPIMARFWKEREAMGTLVVGLRSNADRDVRQVGAQLHMYRNTPQHRPHPARQGPQPPFRRMTRP